MEPLIKIVNSSFIKNFLVAFPKGNIYLVGGCIRDILLDKESFDFDLVVENVSQDELISFLEEEGNVTTVYGRNFGVVKFRPKLFSIIFDIALPRREKYLPGQRRKHAAVELEGISIYEDLARRDFTINAMALDFRSIISSKQKTEIEKYLIDPFDGLKDLKHKIVRTVGDPKDRFSEDPTRILRGVRFAAQFNFVIEPDTLSAMRELADQVTKKFTSKDGCEVERVSHEMIGVEFTKSLDRDPKRTVELYDQTNLLKLLLPEVEALKMIEQPPQFHSEGDVYTHTLLAISKLPKDVSINVKIATLLHDIGKPLTYKSAKDTGDRVRFNRHDEVGAALARQICQRFCLSNNISDSVEWMIRNHIKLFFSFLNMRREKQKALVRNQSFDDLLNLAKADTMASLSSSGKPDLSRYTQIVKLTDELKEEDKNRPKEIINGREIIETIKERKPKFDHQKHGKYIGALKKKINTLYDRGELDSKDAAKKYLINLISR